MTERLEERLGRLLRQRGQTLAVAESCSGGLICHRITNVSGASDYFQGGVVTYSNEAKIELLGVPEETLTAHGAVSGDTAMAMAAGVRDLFHTDLGLSVTGIAGPTGGTPQKPVGTVFIAMARKDWVEARLFRFTGDREAVKTQTSDAALDWLCRELAA